jgi:hypothetical protein
LLLLTLSFVYRMVHLEEELLHLVDVRLFRVYSLLHGGQLIAVLFFVVSSLSVKFEEQVLVGRILVGLCINQFGLKLLKLVLLDF